MSNQCVKGYQRRRKELMIELYLHISSTTTVSPEQCLIQQTKNIRMNKAILSKLHELPFSESEDNNSLYTLSMDWIGYKGYMFGVKKNDNIYVATHIRSLSMPEHLFQFPNLVHVLDALYCWKNHHNNLEDILLPTLITKQENSFFSQFNTKDVNDVNSFPNIYLNPMKSKHSNKNNQ
ncbi:hypothetical protein INT47_002498 [Mucor saturninus]|uniref:Uncharacterized protein n=1 Tax=Mucor saturninus TaxID=64648 RepID=A0A8H7RJ24_9FUNG|nr:hypothetical protein INT47_002498 [Mucor saturninus]